jgi:predicted AAA+ superfamily ATPase
MEILLEELYKNDFSFEKYQDRKIFLDNQSYQICGITQCGKTKLVKNYLAGLKKRSYLYIDCEDERLEITMLNEHLGQFCHKNKIDTLVLDNYKEEIHFVNVAQLIIITQEEKEYSFLKTIHVNPLDYEEFLAYEHKYDSTALNHYLQLGSLPVMHKLSTDERVLYLQKKLKCTLSNIEFEILKFIAKLHTTALSAFTIYERLKQKQKISKDKTYASYKLLVKKMYIYELQKFQGPKAIKKLYLADIFFKTALSTDKHFGRLFENMVFLELIKKKKQCYYYDEIDFYLPDEDTIILCKPFADERRLFKKLETIEAFLFSYKVQKVIAITMSKESTISHPLSHVEMLPFDIWALGD